MLPLFYAPLLHQHFSITLLVHWASETMKPTLLSKQKLHTNSLLLWALFPDLPALQSIRHVSKILLWPVIIIVSIILAFTTVIETKWPQPTKTQSEA